MSAASTAQQHRLRAALFLLEHGNVGAAELLRLDAGFNDGVDLAVVRPDVLEHDRLAVRVMAEHVLLDIETDGAGDGVGACCSFGIGFGGGGGCIFGAFGGGGGGSGGGGAGRGEGT